MTATPGERGEAPQRSPSRFRELFADPRAVGHEPDVRFTLANERTFLAWIRTSLALVGVGLAIEKLVPAFGGRTLLAIVLMLLGLALATTSYVRWARNELALRTDKPLPASRQPLLVAIGVTLVAILAVILIVVGGQ